MELSGESFTNVRLMEEFFESEDFFKYLKKEFAVFLKLNEDRGYSITINGKSLDYQTVIADSETYC